MSKGGLALSFAIVDIVSVLIHPELMAGDLFLLGSDLAVSGVRERWAVVERKKAREMGSDLGDVGERQEALGMEVCGSSAQL